MQLVASVRESLTHQLKEGQSIGVQIERLEQAVQRDDQRDRARSPVQ